MMPTPNRLDQLMAQTAISREIIVDQTATSELVAGQRGAGLEIRLPSYRSLPLACIERIGLKIDGESIDLSAAYLRVDNAWYALTEFPDLLDVWWFILDTAVLFVPASAWVGRFAVEVEIVRVEPYITAGRFSFTSIGNADVAFEEAANG